MSEIDKLISFATRPDLLHFPSSQEAARALAACGPELQSTRLDGATFCHLKAAPGVETTRIKVYPTGHRAYYSPEGHRFLTLDPEGSVLHEADWVRDADSGEMRLAHVRMQLDSKQWIGLKPRAKTFRTEIDIKGQPGWQDMTLDDLRKKAAEAWKVPFSEVKYFYNDANIVPKGDGKYDIHLTKDSLYALIDGTFDQTLFMSFMFSVNWERLDLIPVVELFQSTLPGSGGACFEYIWGLHEDQSREQTLEPLRYRGLPTYPSKEAFNIFCAFFTPQPPEGKQIQDIFKIFMDPDTSHRIQWTPRPTPPWRHFSEAHQITLATQEGLLYKVTAHDDPVPIPYVNAALGGKPSCQRHVQVGTSSLELIDGKLVREIPFYPSWRLAPQTDLPKKLPPAPFDWKWFFNGFPPQADPVKAQYTVPFYPEGAAEIEESALQPMVLDQIFYYMEMSPGMPAKLEKIQKVLIHTFDTVIAGCVDCTQEREYTVLFSDPEFAQKNACLLWNYAAQRKQLDNLKKVSFLPEAENVAEVYKEKYGLIFKWIPFMYFQDREDCESMLRALVDALTPDGILFLVGPRPIQGLFPHYGLDCLYSDPVANMPFFRQHLKMCPENRVNPEIVVFLAEKKEATKPETAPPAPPEKEEIPAPPPLIRDFTRKIN